MQYTRHLALLTFLITSAASAQPYELSFWPLPNATKDPRVLRIEEHPCGEVAIANVAVIPPYKKDRALIPERVLEVGASGKVIRRWWLPTDSFIQAITEDMLTIEHASKTYTVRPGGVISLTKAAADLPAKGERPACRVPSELLPSDYALCQVFKDTKSGLPRQLAYEAVCS